tara:strand:- start:90 stop:578 length:489 start_codon:yes stop_codon:yes gene_type:complete
LTGKIIVVRRTKEEINIFGGEVFIDIDGVNVGKLAEIDFDYSIPIGRHKIKMYKTHSFGTHIGISEVEIDVTENIPLVVKYTNPMHVNSPGNIIVTEYKSSKDINDIVAEADKILSSERIENENIKKEQEKQGRKYIKWAWIFVALFILFFISLLLETALLY